MPRITGGIKLGLISSSTVAIVGYRWPADQSTLTKLLLTSHCEPVAANQVTTDESLPTTAIYLVSESRHDVLRRP